MRTYPPSRPLAYSGGLPPGTGWSLAGNLLRPLRWLAGGSVATAAALTAALFWLPLGEGEAEAVAFGPASASPRGVLAPETLPTEAPAPAPAQVVVAEAPALEPAVPVDALVSAAPLAAPAQALQGEASYYAAKFEGRRTASGEPYSGSAFTAAHRTLPFGTRVRVTNARNGRSVVVRINDRGPFHPRRVIDVSRTVAAELGFLRRGRDAVELEILGR